jgi:hypothetical protein
MKYTKSILIMICMVLLATVATFAAEQRTIEGSMQTNAYGEQVLQCIVTGSSAQDGFKWEVKFLGDDQWYGVIDTAYNPYHWTALRELKNEKRIKYWSTTADDTSFGYKDGWLINATNIEAWKCSFKGHNGDLLPVYFPMKSALPPVKNDEIYMYITNDGKNNLKCNVLGIVPDSFAWYENTVSTKVGTTSDLANTIVKPDTKYICEISYAGGITKRVGYATAPTKIIRNVDVVCSDPVIKNHLQTCAVHVDNEYNQDMTNAGVVLIQNGTQKAMGITNADGNTNLIFNVNELGTFTATVRVSKEGYVAVEEDVTYTVLKEKYQIQNFVFSNQSDLGVLKTEFYRGDEFFVSFKVWDSAITDFVKTPLKATVTLEGAAKTFMVGGFDTTKNAFVYHTTIPLTDSYLSNLTKTFVVAIAIDDAQMIDGGAQDEKDVTILNNLPTINAPDYVAANEMERIQFRVDISDKEMYTSSELKIDITGMPGTAYFQNGEFVWRPQYGEAGIYPVTFTVTDRNGGQSAHVTVIAVNKSSDVSVLITKPLNNQEVEFGQNVSFEVAITNPNNVPITYSWNFGDGTIETSANGNIMHAFNKVGKQNVVLTYSFAGKTAQAWVNVIVKPAKDCSVQIVNPKGFERWFVGTDAILFEATTDCSIPYTITWNFADGNTATGNTVPHTYATAGQYIVVANITTAANSDLDNVTVNVHAKSDYYEVVEIKTFKDMSSIISNTESSSFFRGDAMYVTFKVIDTSKGNAPVENAPIRDVYVKKQDMTGGFSDFNEFMYLNGVYYYKLDAIPLMYDIVKPDYVVAIALDNDNGLARANKAVSILNNLPVVKITSPLNNQAIDCTAILAGTATDRENGNSVTQKWSIDGAVVTTTSVSLVSGTHTIKLEGTDLDNGVSADQVSVTVTCNATPTPIAPTAVVVPSMSSCSASGSVVKFDGTASHDNDNIGTGSPIVSYVWTIDGQTQSTPIVEYTTLATSGVISYQLTVVDNDGQSNVATGNFVITSDGCVIPPNADELRDAMIQLPIKFKQVNIPSQVNAGNYVRTYIVVTNELVSSKGKLEDLTLTVSVQGLGVSRQANFDLDPKESKDFSFYLPISSNANGYFPIKITVSNGEAKREIYRSVIVN